MRPKKTISSWLNSRHQLILRNEENFAEKTSFAFSYSRLILFSMLAFLFMLLLSLFLVKTVLKKWFDPKYEQMVVNQQLYGLALKVDSLALEVEHKDQFIANLQSVLRGDTTLLKNQKTLSNGTATPGERPELNIAPGDSAFRENFERSDLSLITLTSSQSRSLRETYFFTPINGFISDRYDVRKGHFGVDVVSKTNEPVKSIADGTVVFSSWTQDAGYVMMIQHNANLISVYKHNAELYKKVGTFVNAGEIISIVGNSGELTNGPHLHFELWYNGNSINPEEFVTF